MLHVHTLCVWAQCSCEGPEVVLQHCTHLQADAPVHNRLSLAALAPSCLHCPEEPRAALLRRSSRKSLNRETLGRKNLSSIDNVQLLTSFSQSYYFFYPFYFCCSLRWRGVFWSGTETAGCLLTALKKNSWKVGAVCRGCRSATRACTVLRSYWSNAGFVRCPFFLAVVFARGGFVFMSRGWLCGNGWAVGRFVRPSCCMCVWLCSVLLIDGGD